MLTGGSSDYYKVRVENPTHQLQPYTAEANDIIEALSMSFAEGNILKAVIRHALVRQGTGKQGSTAKYEAEKIAWYGERLVAQAELNDE